MLLKINSRGRSAAGVTRNVLIFFRVHMHAYAADCAIGVSFSTSAAEERRVKYAPVRVFKFRARAVRSRSCLRTHVHSRTWLVQLSHRSRYVRTIAARATNCAVYSDCRHALLLCRTIRRVVRLYTGCRSFHEKSLSFPFLFSFSSSFLSFLSLSLLLFPSRIILDNGSYTCCGKRASSGFAEAISRTWQIVTCGGKK